MPYIWGFLYSVGCQPASLLIHIHCGEKCNQITLMFPLMSFTLTLSNSSRASPATTNPGSNLNWARTIMSESSVLQFAPRNASFDVSVCSPVVVVVPVGVANQSTMSCRLAFLLSAMSAPRADHCAASPHISGARSSTSNSFELLSLYQCCCCCFHFSRCWWTSFTACLKLQSSCVCLLKFAQRILRRLALYEVSFPLWFYDVSCRHYLHFAARNHFYFTISIVCGALPPVFISFSKKENAFPGPRLCGENANKKPQLLNEPVPGLDTSSSCTVTVFIRSIRKWIKNTAAVSERINIFIPSYLEADFFLCSDSQMQTTPEKVKS